MRLVFISDTHNQTAFSVPDGDALIHSGDATMNGTASEIIAFNAWLEKQPHRYKIFVAGNHDVGFEKAPEAAQRLLTVPMYLEHSSIKIEGVKFFGSPYTPAFYDWAFNRTAGELAEQWKNIPEDTG
jgi:predicted phosphodiesterase